MVCANCRLAPVSTVLVIHRYNGTPIEKDRRTLNKYSLFFTLLQKKHSCLPIFKKATPVSGMHDGVWNGIKIYTMVKAAKCTTGKSGFRALPKSGSSTTSSYHFLGDTCKDPNYSPQALFGQSLLSSTNPACLMHGVSCRRGWPQRLLGDAVRALQAPEEW